MPMNEGTLSMDSGIAAPTGGPIVIPRVVERVDLVESQIRCLPHVAAKDGLLRLGATDRRPRQPSFAVDLGIGHRRLLGCSLGVATDK